MAEIEYFYAAHSVFAYLGAAKLHAIAAASGRKIVHRPMYLAPVVGAVYEGGFAGRSANHISYYFGREIERWAEYRGVPIGKGIPANHSNSTTLANSMLIACAAKGGDTDALALAVMRAHWVDHADLADRDGLAAIATTAGFDADNLLADAQTAATKAIYEANTAEAIKRSVFGSPTYFIDGDMFYGQDRLELVERAIGEPFAHAWD